MTHHLGVEPALMPYNMWKSSIRMVAMSFDPSLRGPYSNPPTPDDPGIRAAMDASLPESIAGLAWSRPDLSSIEHKIVLSFSIAAKKRHSGELIPCAMCSGGHPKFLSGAILWSPDGWLRIIGHMCAAKPENFGVARYRRLQAEYKQIELDKITMDWLEDSIPSIKLLTKDVAILRDAMTFMEVQQKAFFKGVPELARLLADIIKRHGGRLTISQEISAARIATSDSVVTGLSTRSSLSRYEEVQIGALQGAAFLDRPRFTRSHQIQDILRAFDRIPDGKGDESLLALMNGGEQEITITAGAALRAVQRALKLAADYADAAAFMSPNNIAILEKWGRHPRNGMPFDIRHTSWDMTFKLGDLSRACIARAWPKLVDLSAWQTLADTGVNLDSKLPA
jgi:hypothetical protein